MSDDRTAIEVYLDEIGELKADLVAAQEIQREWAAEAGKMQAKASDLDAALTVCRARNETLEREWEAELTKFAERINAGWMERYNRQWKPMEARNETLEAARSEAMKALSWFYDDHVIEGDPPCPCTGCEKARAVFAAALAFAAEPGEATT